MIQKRFVSNLGYYFSDLIYNIALPVVALTQIMA